jgi:PAS domain S-box-containing protein
VAQGIADGEVRRQALETSNDELGALARTFNKMTGDLIEARERLEQKVGERTIALQTEVAEHEETEKALRHERNVLRTLMANIPDHIYFKDRYHRFTRISHALGRWFGLEDPAEAKGKSDHDFFSNEHAEETRRDEETIMRTGVPIVGKEEKETWPDGRETWVSTSKVPLRDDQGNIVGTFGLSRDITGHKQAERAQALHMREVEQLNREMSDLLEDLRKTNSRLETATAQLEEANAELESFSYTVSHDLRAPLRAIRGFTDAVQEDYGATLGEEGRHYLDRIRRNTEEMAQLITDLLAFSRLNRQVASPTDVDMEALVREAWDEIGDPAGREVTFRLGTLAPARGDPALLRQVWANLLSNALKFTAPRDHAVVEVGCRLDEVPPVYYVKDNGVGFDMQYADKLFGAFQRMHAIRDFEGSGVGLAIVARIVRRHGGRVWAEGEPERGAVFSFTLSNGEHVA